MSKVWARGRSSTQGLTGLLLWLLLLQLLLLVLHTLSRSFPLRSNGDQIIHGAPPPLHRNTSARNCFLSRSMFIILQKLLLVVRLVVQ
mmetsp:Transcript_22165/g.67286  ORF Transcript_22165/g.67286 Transcript_22165/m.67286 type:complete len:88 (-) Transcript_22165:203-466(-)